MKKSVILSVAVVFTMLIMGFGIMDSNEAKPTIEWGETTHDFGTIKQGIQVETSFEFKNTSMVPVIITNVKASCGCTVPSYPKEPVKAGETASIKATYNAKNLGHFSKSITVNSNAVEPVQVLYIKGEVVE